MQIDDRTNANSMPLKTVLECSQTYDRWAKRVLRLSVTQCLTAHPEWERTRYEEARDFLDWLEWSRTTIGAQLSWQVLQHTKESELPLIWSKNKHDMYKVMRWCTHWMHAVTRNNSQRVAEWLALDDRLPPELSPYTDDTWVCPAIWEEQLAESPTALVPPKKDMDYSCGSYLDYTGGPEEKGIWGQAAVNAKIFGHEFHQ
jgi:hypothetical protein